MKMAPSLSGTVDWSAGGMDAGAAGLRGRPDCSRVAARRSSRAGGRLLKPTPGIGVGMKMVADWVCQASG